MPDFGIPDVSNLSEADLERLLTKFRKVPTEPAEAFERAQGYIDIIRAELSARRS